MRKITTSKGTEHEVDFAWAPTFDGKCMIQMHDERRFPEISDEFDGLESIHFIDGEAEREYDFDGYTKLVWLIRNSDGSIQIQLAKEV